MGFGKGASVSVGLGVAVIAGRDMGDGASVGGGVSVDRELSCSFSSIRLREKSQARSTRAANVITASVYFLITLLFEDETGFQAPPNGTSRTTDEHR